MKANKVLSAVLVIAILISCFPAMLAMADDPADELVIDSTKWLYNEEDGVYYQLELEYCAKPESPYEKIGIYVPGAYMETTPNGDGTYTMTGKTATKIGNYTAATAPMVIPVDTGSWKAIAPHDEYKPSAEAKKYLEHGYIYLNIGVRGKDRDSSEYSNFLPWAVVDFKAAIRYLRYNKELVPGATDRFFSLGHSAGGAQSGLIGGTGNAEEFFPYLDYIGALGVEKKGDTYESTISDAICGCLQYCPIASHRATITGYEWMMGQFLDNTVPEALVTSKGSVLAGYTSRSAEGTFKAQLSDDMAEMYGKYVNTEVKLLDPETGERLTLDESDDGYYLAGSYYDFYMDQINLSLNNYLAYQKQQDTNFDPAAYVAEKGARLEDDGYTDTVGSADAWIEYDAASGTATVDSMRDFIVYCKISSVKDVVSSDGLEHSSTNFSIVDGSDDGKQVHYSKSIADMIEAKKDVYSTLEGWKADYLSYLTEPTADENKDAVGNTPRQRSDFCDQLYYSNPEYPGYGKADLAKYWRIHSGIAQSDVGLNTEGNLYLSLAALKNEGVIEDVEFAMLWDQKHVKAEAGGASTSPDEFIKWVDEILTSEPAGPAFTDVAAGEYYADAVAWAVEKGITAGLTATTFGPNASCTRAQMVTFLWRAAGSPAAGSSNPFADVDSGAYYYDAVLWAVEKGITSGTSAGSFSPDAAVNRAQTVTFLYRYAGSPTVDGAGSFSDVADGEYYAPAVQWAVDKGVTTGTSETTFSPANDCTRGQIVTFLYRYMG